MPKFIVTVQQYVEETATMTVYAADEAAARAAAKEMLDNGDVDPDWEDGNDIQPAEVIAAKLA